MTPFRRKIVPAFATPPTETSPSVAAEARIARCNENAWKAWLRGDIEVMDGWLDMRNAIRPARPGVVPVNPGRPT